MKHHRPHYGKTLKDFRDRLGLSDSVVAARVGIARMTYRSYEESVERPTNSWRFDEAKILDVLGTNKKEFEQAWLNGSVELVSRIPSDLADQVQRTVKRRKLSMDDAGADAWQKFVEADSH